MKRWRVGLLAVGYMALLGCGGGSWVHPNKHQDEFAQDWNKCQGDVLRDPKLQQGNNYLLIQATERCVMKKGWVLKQGE